MQAEITFLNIFNKLNKNVALYFKLPYDCISAMIKYFSVFSVIKVVLQHTLSFILSTIQTAFIFFCRIYHDIYINRKVTVYHTVTENRRVRERERVRCWTAHSRWTKPVSRWMTLIKINKVYCVCSKGKG